MSKLTINFLGEEIKLDFPDTKSTLYQKIMDNFFLSEKDVTELLITYSQDYKNFLIEDEKDFKDFVKAKVNKIDIDINQSSELYKNSLFKVQKENENIKKKYDEIIQQVNEINKQEKEKKEKMTNEIEEINKKITALETQKKEIIKKIDKEIEDNKKKIDKIKKNAQKEIKPLEKQKKKLYKAAGNIGIKLGMKSKIKQSKKNDNIIKEEKKDENKKDENKKDEIKIKNEKEIPVINQIKEIKKDEIKEIEEENDNEYECDGCSISPIKGKVFHCETCGNFDFCDKCYSEKKVEHYNFLHKFICLIKKSEKNEEKNIFETIHHNIRCNICKKNNIKGIRYKCAICPDFNFCENCEMNKGKQHGHPLIRLPCEDMLKNINMKNINENAKNILGKVACNKCKKKIEENIYKCGKCSNYYLCEKCIGENQFYHFDPFIKYY